MTDREKAIVMAYTGVCMLTGNKFQIFHEYVENIMGRPIQTIEMGMDSVADGIKEKARPDFLKLCEEDQEPCDDAVSRQAVLDLPRIKTHNVWGNVIYESVDVENVRQLPPVTSQPNVGRWIYDKNIDNWRCSECGETPKTMGYCGSADFMAKHFKYCNHCGAKMQEVEDA